MKTLFRVLVILVVTAIIGGLMYAGVTASGSAATFTNFEEGQERPQRPDGAEFRPDGEREEREGGAGLPAGVIKALFLMTVAGGAYSVVIWTSKKARQVIAA